MMRYLLQLQDPESKKEIISDEVLKKLTGQERFTAFGCAQVIAAAHVSVGAMCHSNKNDMHQ